MCGETGESIMKKPEIQLVRILIFAVIFLSGSFFISTVTAAPGIPQNFDSNGEKIYNRFNETPIAAMSGTDGKRTFNTFYSLRQYPGSPPMIPHSVKASFSNESSDCIACHGRGGFSAAHNAYVPVSPHPENELCYQCHVPKIAKQLFKETIWESIPPPTIGYSQMGGSPPPIPHSLQLREDCIACHTGPAAVAEIRVEHGSRGNCRQCHVVLLTSQPQKVFSRKEISK